MNTPARSRVVIGKQIAGRTVVRQAPCAPVAAALRVAFNERVFATEIRFARSGYSFTVRKRNAFAITETELKLIAAPAIIGLRRTPKNG